MRSTLVVVESSAAGKTHAGTSCRSSGATVVAVWNAPLTAKVPGDEEGDGKREGWRCGGDTEGRGPELSATSSRSTTCCDIIHYARIFFVATAYPQRVYDTAYRHGNGVGGLVAWHTVVQID